MSQSVRWVRNALIASTSSPAPSVTKKGNEGRSPARTSPTAGTAAPASINARRMSSSGNSINNIYDLRSTKCSQLDRLAPPQRTRGLVKEALATEELVAPREGLLVLDDPIAGADHAEGLTVGGPDHGVAVGDRAIAVLGVPDEDRLLGQAPAGETAVLERLRAIE